VANLPEGVELDETAPYWSPDPAIRERQKYERRKQKPNRKKLVQVSSRRYYRKHKSDPAFQERKRTNSKSSRNSPENHPKFLMNARKYYRTALRDKLLEIYGSKCACCGEANKAFLTLDHIRNDGKEDRAKEKHSAQVYRKAIKKPDRTVYQILCYNCNLGKGRNGGVCPHVTANKELGDGANMRWGRTENSSC
jgi:hypothetical protein